MKKIADLREEMKKSAASELTALEEEYNVAITIAAKRYIRQLVASTFKVNSPDIKRAGEVVIARHNKNPYRKQRGSTRGYAYLIENTDSVEKTRKSIQEVISLAAQNATTEFITVENIDSAISAKWCKVFPLCCARTSKKLTLPIVLGDDYEHNK